MLKIAGEEAELFPRLHSRAGENNAIDLLGAECGNGHGHGQIGFARAGGAVRLIRSYCVGSPQYTLLPEGFRLYGFAARGDADAVRREGVNFILAAFLHQGEDIPHVLLAERFAAVNER